MLHKLLHKNLKHIVKRGNSYYLRVRVPTHLVDYLNRREITKTLKTSDPEIAQVRADMLLSQLKMQFSTLEQQLHLNSLNILPHDISPFRVQTVPQPVVKEIPSASTEIIAIEESNNDVEGLLISVCIKEYKTSLHKQDLTVKTINDYVLAPGILLEFTGDVIMCSLTKKDFVDFKKALMSYPANRKKKAAYKDKTFAELMEMDIPEHMLIDVRTFNKYITRLSQFLNYCVAHDHIDINHATSLHIRTNKKKKKTGRTRYTKHDLTRMFATTVYINHSYTQAFQFWLPIIGLYTGGRLAELCQLTVNDIYSVDGVFIIDINEDNGKVKNDNSIRKVPVHSHLIELGFLHFVNGQEDQLFNVQRNSIGDFAQPSKWFGEYRKKLGLFNLKPKKDFHSFRHTLLHELKQKKVPILLRKAIAGHGDGDLTEEVYAEEYEPAVLQEEIEKICFRKELESIRGWVHED